MILYVFISHKNKILNCHERIKSMMIEDFIIVCGGSIKDQYDKDKNVLRLNCNDDYLGLSEKVTKTFHYILSNEVFDKYTHFVKLDDDMEVVNRFEYQTFKELDYFGLVCECENESHYNRRWHMGKTGTYWDNIPYQGKFKPFCSGGFGYGVSRKALELVLPNFDYLINFYEDVNMGLLLNKVGIVPKNIPKIRRYIKSPEHNNEFITQDDVNFYQNDLHLVLNNGKLVKA